MAQNTETKVTKTESTVDASMDFIPTIYQKNHPIETRLKYAKLIWTPGKGYKVHSVKGNRMTYSPAEWMIIANGVQEVRDEMALCNGELVCREDPEFNYYLFSRPGVKAENGRIAEPGIDIRLVGTWFELEEKAYFFIRHLQQGLCVKGQGFTIDIDECLPFHPENGGTNLAIPPENEGTDDNDASSEENWNV